MAEQKKQTVQAPIRELRDASGRLLARYDAKRGIVAIKPKHGAEVRFSLRDEPEPGKG